jgi:hypothetical protein
MVCHASPQQTVPLRGGSIAGTFLLSDSHLQPYHFASLCAILRFESSLVSLTTLTLRLSRARNAWLGFDQQNNLRMLVPLRSRHRQELAVIAVNDTGSASQSFMTLLKQIQTEILPSPNALYGLKALLATLDRAIL